MNLIKIASAGSGKTWGLCEDALSRQQLCSGTHAARVIIVTYTQNGKTSILNTLNRQNSAYPRDKVIVRTWYDFLYNEIIKPYQVLLHDCPINYVSGVNFDHMHERNFHKKESFWRYIDLSQRVRANYCAELAYLFLKHSGKEAIHRLEDIYAAIYLDECQDYAGYDLDIIKYLFQSKISVTCVGDPKQSTFVTNFSAKNKGQKGRNFAIFAKDVKAAGLTDIAYCTYSRRFNSWIASFSNTISPSEPLVTSAMDKTTDYDGVFFIHEDEALSYFSSDNENIKVLRYNVNSDTKGIPALNYGDSKGRTFNRVMIFPNEKLKAFILGKNSKLSATEKYYIAVTRARYSIVFVVSDVSVFKSNEYVLVQCGDKSVKLYKHPIYAR